MIFFPRRPSAATTTAPLALAVLACLAVLTACGGAGGSTTATAAAGSATTASGSASGAAGFAAYRQCLQQHGVTLPTRPAGTAASSAGGGFAGRDSTPSPQMSAAQQACASLRPAGGFGGQRISASALAAFRSCMKDHGVTVPTPTAATSTGPAGAPSPGGSATAVPFDRGGGFLGGLRAGDAKVAKALSVCRVLLPTRPTASPSTSAP